MRAPLIALLGAALLAGPALAQPSQFRAPGNPAPATPAPAAPAPAAPAAPAPGATEESRAAARELVALLNSDAQSEQMMTAVTQSVATALAQSSGKPVAEVMAIVDEVLMPEFRLRMPELRAFTIELWAAQMTAPELRQLKAFYETPLGRRLQEVTPAVAAASATFGMKWGQEVALSALAKHRETLRARGLKI
jgi:hypothetical protein